MISKEENILFAAEKLFAERGFEKTSTREISREANVNISMISYYFGSKEKLLESLFEMRMAESQTYIKEIMAKPDLNEWQKISLIIDRYTERVRTYKVFYTILQTEQLTNKNEQIIRYLENSKKGFLDMYQKLVDDGFQNKTFKKKPNIAMMHATLSGTMFYAMNGLPMYKDYFSINKENIDYDQQYFQDLNLHIKEILKHILGYEENK
ncbi:TetR/AcrR family transcriptional regulator [Frigoriflavimonas asaccharolytica]|uniref:AcrR family transcriptional regulator n=1 Tax=Frigoriflavimonas asaccharolytica TaxID=2735899 RepID=A0A8J8G8T2_9FLAO|nr:TetR/AcrR family transcriptional regulator [Frigoriflavimonas asaccharolytica]NRS93431.1 AcrR family transcriptional regulator [Frigoriflavimonas asaccharolytica]